MSEAQEATKRLCPRTCLDCCCEVHHWGQYGPEEDEDGEIIEDDTVYSCKHCPARLGAEEVCVRCEVALIEHDEFDCPDGKGVFRYEGEPKRVCTLVHPWDGGERREI